MTAAIWSRVRRSPIPSSDGAAGDPFDDFSRICATLDEQAADFFAGIVCANDADDADGCAQCREVGGDAARAAEAEFFALVMEDGDGGFGGEAFGVAVHVAVEHEVAEEDDVAAREALDEFDEAGGHWISIVHEGMGRRR